MGKGNELHGIVTCTEGKTVIKYPFRPLSTLCNLTVHGQLT